MAKADNLLAVLWLLRSRRRVTAAEIAESLEISLRTAYRYIDALSASGVPVMAETGPDGGYSLPERFRSVPLFFEHTELVALFQAALFARQSGYPHTSALEAALEKVRRNLSPGQAADLERHMAGLVVVGTRRGGPVEPWLPDLEQAVAEGATVEISYWKPDAEAPEIRTIDPYCLVYRSGLWYVTAFCHLRQDQREFRVDRVRHLRRNGSTFQRPPGFQPEEGETGDWIQKRVNQGPTTRVEVSGPPWAMAGLAEHWYLRHCLLERAGRHAVFGLDPIGLQHAAHHFASLGGAVTIHAPADLRQRVAGLLSEWLKHHEAKHP